MFTSKQSVTKSIAAIAALSVGIASCSGGGSGGDGGSPESGNRVFGANEANFDCDGRCPNQSLSADDVNRILRQAVAGAMSFNAPATIAVTDRVGNVLGVYQMDGAPATALITTAGADGTFMNGGQGGLVGIEAPATLAAISKAGTGAYLSSQGNAFTTRTASQIVQQNFNPGEARQAGGPLFGVQFSQLLCSDTNNLNPDFAAGLSVMPDDSFQGGLVGPRPLPLGLSADPGGLPIYKNGDVVGGIGVELNGRYSLDPVVTNFDDDTEEKVALLGLSNGFESPSDRTADKIFVLGKSLRYTDVGYEDFPPLSGPLPELEPQRIIGVPGFSGAGALRAGATFGDPSSGIARVTRGNFSAAVLVDQNGNPRFPTRAGTPQNGSELQPAEVDSLLLSSLQTAERARAAIRTPRDSQVHVSIWVVDVAGNPIGFVRTFDGPVFGIDVALQKARTALFFSSADAGATLVNAGVGQYVDAVRERLGADALTGTHAFADRSGGNLSRPFFPDGVTGNRNGPFSLPFPGTQFVTDPANTWSPFNTGLQLDLILDSLAQALFNGNIRSDCIPAASGRLRNGIQIFPGSVPLYRNGTLVGGLGISGDGIDQDDLIAFFSASRRGLDFVGASVGDPDLGFNAPREIRADQLTVQPEGVRLRYVNCPEAPFRGDNSQNVCEGL